MKPTPTYETINSAAERAQVTQRTILKWLQQGRLTRYRVGTRGVRIDRAELDELIRPIAVSSRARD